MGGYVPAEGKEGWDLLPVDLCCGFAVDDGGEDYL
jgi:hypothetical protein